MSSDALIGLLENGNMNSKALIGLLENGNMDTDDLLENGNIDTDGNFGLNAPSSLQPPASSPRNLLPTST
jgi:hypothetical protein